MLKKKSGRVVGSRYLQKTENVQKSSTAPVHETSSKLRPMSELKLNSATVKPVNTTAKLKQSNTKYSNNPKCHSEGDSDGLEEYISWAYLYQQSQLSLDDYKKEQDNILINLAGQVVLLNEELYEKQSKAEIDKNLKSDVSNLKSAFSSLSSINKSLDSNFLDLFDGITRELGARINQIELDNATVYNQGALENVIIGINELLSRISADFGHNLNICKENLDMINKECVTVKDEFSRNVNLLNMVNQAKIKNMGLFNSIELQSDDSNK